MMQPLIYILHARRPEFRAKVRWAMTCVRQYISKDAYVSWSGGKDSTVVVEMCTSVNPQIKILHIANDYHLPDSRAYMQSLIEEWNLNYSEIQSPVDYMELCREFGLPHLRTPATQQAVVQRIKKSVAAEWAQEEGFTRLFWGLRAEESVARRAFGRYKGRAFRGKDGLERISPIIDWTARDIFAYHYIESIPINPIYLKENCGFTRETLRNTGWLSTDGESRGQLEWLRRNYPRQYAMLREEMQCP